MLHMMTTRSRLDPDSRAGSLRARAVGRQRPSSKRPNWLRSGRQAAVDHEHLAGDERGFVRGEIECQSADVVGLAEPADRLLAHELLTPRFVLPRSRR